MSVKQMAYVFESELEPTKRLVMLAYADHASHDGKNIYPAVETIANKTGLSRRTVQRATRELEETGWLVDDGEGPHGTRKWMMQQGGRQSDTGVTDDVGGVSLTTRGGVTVTPEPSLEPSLEPSTGKESPFYTVAGVIFKFAKDEIPKTSRQLVARAMNALQEAHPDVRAEDIKAFAGWWDSEKDGIALPRDPAKLQAHYLEYRNRHLMNEGATGEDGAVEMGGWA